MVVLVTGGTGFIGSHTVLHLIENKHQVIIVDDLSNSEASVLDNIEKISGVRPLFYQIDATKKEDLERVFKENKINAVMHFAGKKAVGESVKLPLLYYRVNLDSTLSLLELMAKYQVNNFIFSSSATVYGQPKKMPIKESNKTGATTNPYGTTKVIIEQILKDATLANPKLKVTLLRYFNPIGAHKSGLLGEKPQGIPNNLMPYITQVAFGLLPELKVYGDDYKTIDGTGVRDYIHVEDLARGHVLALDDLKHAKQVKIYNLGTGKGVSVLQIIKAFEKANKITIPYKIVERRKGDIDVCYADTSLAFKKLGFKAEKTLEEACHDSYTFQKMNYVK
jgi:UDP-glucose 4-epimerase